MLWKFPSIALNINLDYIIKKIEIKIYILVELNLRFTRTNECFCLFLGSHAEFHNQESNPYLLYSKDEVVATPLGKSLDVFYEKNNDGKLTLLWNLLISILIICKSLVLSFGFALSLFLLLPGRWEKMIAFILS